MNTAPIKPEHAQLLLRLRDMPWAEREQLKQLAQSVFKTKEVADSIHYQNLSSDAIARGYKLFDLDINCWYASEYPSFRSLEFKLICRTLDLPCPGDGGIDGCSYVMIWQSHPAGDKGVEFICSLPCLIAPLASESESQ